TASKDLYAAEFNFVHNVNNIGLTLYEHPNYQGYRKTFNADDNDLCDDALNPDIGYIPCNFSVPSWTDNASSLKLTEGWSARLNFHNLEDAKNYNDYAEAAFNCSDGQKIPTLASYNFPNGHSVNENISRVYVFASCDGAG